MKTSELDLAIKNEAVHRPSKDRIYNAIYKDDFSIYFYDVFIITIKDVNHTYRFLWVNGFLDITLHKTYMDHNIVDAYVKLRRVG
jgi:hypothetical protein